MMLAHICGKASNDSMLPATETSTVLDGGRPSAWDPGWGWRAGEPKSYTSKLSGQGWAMSNVRESQELSLQEKTVNSD